MLSLKCTPFSSFLLDYKKPDFYHLITRLLELFIVPVSNTFSLVYPPKHCQISSQIFISLLTLTQKPPYMKQNQNTSLFQSLAQSAPIYLMHCHFLPFARNVLLQPVPETHAHNTSVHSAFLSL